MSEIDAAILEVVLLDLAARLPREPAIEILLVGGAAALLGGLLPPALSTVDCDVARHPRQHWAGLRQAAQATGVAFGLSPSWFNTECQQSTIRRLPEDWQARAALRTFGALRVAWIGRLDFIAMKLVAGREKDLEHLRHLAPFAADEVAFVMKYLNELARRFPSEVPFVDDARLALQEVESWSTA